MIQTYLILALAAIFGVGGLMAFMRFLYFGPFSIANFNLDTSRILWMDASLSFAFFIQHSGMIRRPFQVYLTRIVPDGCVKAVYAIASGVILYAMLVLWQPSSEHLFIINGIWRTLMRAVFFISLFGFLWGLQSMGFYDPTGIRDIIDRMRAKPIIKGGVVAKGPYRFIRHPLYLTMMLMIWSYPDMTADRLLFNILWTTWIVMATLLEERDLVAEHGNAYLEYKNNVPMFVPALSFFITRKEDR